MQLTDIVGQSAAVAFLAGVLAGDRRPHAFLFAGPDGVGRRTTAEALAAILLCHNPRSAPNAGRLAGLADEAPVPAACELCPSCRAFDAGTHADYQLVRKELARYSEDSSVRGRVMQDLGIHVIREFLIDPANRRSAQGQGKVFVIRQAELMSVAAQNALLKTLEEPPPGVTLVLLCPTPAELLATIRSRCALVRFGPLGRSFVADRLAAAGVEPAEADFWAGYTAGSIGQSHRLAEMGLYAIKRELVDRLAALADGPDPELGDWLLAQADTLTDILTSADKQLARSLAGRQGAGELLALIASVYRDAMSLSAGRPEALVHADQPDAVARLADTLGLDGAVEVVEQLARYEQLLWANLNAKVVWDNVVLTCATGAPLDV